MEYFLGSFITLAVIFVMNHFFIKNMPVNESRLPMFTQASTYKILSPVLLTNKELRRESEKKTQSTKHLAKRTTRILFLDDKAYWIQNNVFFCADTIDGFVDSETTSKVDIMGMDKVQLKDMSYIVEQLTRGMGDENSNTGK